MAATKYVDLLIPRGGPSHQAVKKKSQGSCHRTGVGDCHVYVDKYANPDGDTDCHQCQNTATSVCNLAESLVVHADVRKTALLGKSYFKEFRLLSSVQDETDSTELMEKLYDFTRRFLTEFSWLYYVC